MTQSSIFSSICDFFTRGRGESHRTRTRFSWSRRGPLINTASGPGPWTLASLTPIGIGPPSPVDLGYGMSIKSTSPGPAPPLRFSPYESVFGSKSNKPLSRSYKFTQYEEHTPPGSLSSSDSLLCAANAPSRATDYHASSPQRSSFQNAYTHPSFSTDSSLSSLSQQSSPVTQPAFPFLRRATSLSHLYIPQDSAVFRFHTPSPTHTGQYSAALTAPYTGLVHTPISTPIRPFSSTPNSLLSLGTGPNGIAPSPLRRYSFDPYSPRSAMPGTSDPLAGDLRLLHPFRQFHVPTSNYDTTHGPPMTGSVTF